jgi:hypothetical protein
LLDPACAKTLSQRGALNVLVIWSSNEEACRVGSEEFDRSRYHRNSLNAQVGAYRDPQEQELWREMVRWSGGRIAEQGGVLLGSGPSP